MKTISFQDILKVSWLQGYNEIDLLSIQMDKEVDRVLDEIGIDTEYPIIYYPCKHRTLDNKIVLGFMACGEVSCNYKHYQSKYFDATDRLVATMYRDIDYAKELAEMLGRNSSFLAQAVDLEGYIADEENNVPPEDDYELVSIQIKQLEELRDRIRGPLYNEAGNPKTREEYLEWYVDQPTHKEEFNAKT